jgi:hypothetical protein
MKARTRVLTVALCFVGLTLCFAEDANIGTWKLNEAKSKIGAGSPKNTTVVYGAAGENVIVTVDGVDANDKPTHNEWTGKFQGKDYPVISDPNSDVRSYTKIDDRTLGFNAKKRGKVTTSGRIVVSADGKSRTVTASGTDPAGKKFRALRYTTSSSGISAESCY